MSMLWMNKWIDEVDCANKIKKMKNNKNEEKKKKKLEEKINKMIL